MIQLSQNLQDQIADAIKTIKADYAEIRAEEFINTRIVYRGADPDLISEPYSLGFFVRVLINGSWGITKFNDLKNLKEKIAEAVSFAKLKGKGDVNLSDTPQVTADISYSLIKDFREISLDKKVELVKKYNQLLLKADKNVKSTNTIYADTYHIKFLVNSRGSKILQIRPSV
ncbi:MAG: DNA gyrase modulator, partial [Nanoarchaeota archaeon]